jgi:hypothetical protein
LDNTQEDFTYIYGNPTSVSAVGSGSVENYGNTNVYCTFNVNGPVIGPAYIRNLSTDQTITLLSPASPSTEAVSTDYWLNIDTYNRTVYLEYNGQAGLVQSNARNLVEPFVGWIYLEPGVNNFEFEDAGTSQIGASLEVHYRSGWIG